MTRTKRPRRPRHRLRCGPASRGRILSTGLLRACIVLVMAVASCHPSRPWTPKIITPKSEPIPVPAPLRHIRQMAFDAYNRALVGNFAFVQQDAVHIGESWQRYREQASYDGAAHRLVRDMDDAVSHFQDVSDASHDRTELARAANQVSRYANELFGLYHPKIPTNVGRLTYLGREVILDVRDWDFEAAAKHRLEILAIFKKLRPQLEKAGAKQLAAAYQKTLSEIGKRVREKDEQGVIHASDAALKLVGKMRTIFEQAPNVATARMKGVL